MHALPLHVLADLGLIFGVAVMLALVFIRSGIPPILAYLGTGIVLGPSGLALVAQSDSLSLLAEVGVVLLLFTVGLEFSLGEIRRSWRAVLLGGGLQVILTTALATGMALAIDLPLPVALCWGFLLTPSSTAVVLRLLEARHETRAAHGRLVVGVLIFQDICVVPMMLMMPMLAGGGEPMDVVTILLQAAGMGIAVALGSTLIVPRLLKHAAASRDREVFMLAVLAIAGVTAYVTSQTGLSLALGAFIAGVILAETQYAHQAMADVLPLRAMTMCVFFVTIGMLLDVDAIRSDPEHVLLLLGAILFGKALIVAIVGTILRSPLRVSMLAGLALAQVGEFSFVLSGVAVESGLIGDQEEAYLLAASVLSIAITPLALALFPRILAGSRLLRPLKRRLDGQDLLIDAREEEESLRDHVIVVGLGVGGRTVVEALEQARISPLIIELNPMTVAWERDRGRHVVFGDSTSPEVLEKSGLHHAKAAVLVLSDPPAAHRTAELIHQLRPELPVLLRTRYVDEEGAERAIGAEVHSEEFAGAISIAGATLRRCHVDDWSQIIDKLESEHETLPPEDEGHLGPPPEGV
jgi:CPA2 family monovalent cation:H+ antiporter-2